MNNILNQAVRCGVQTSPIANRGVGIGTVRGLGQTALSFPYDTGGDSGTGAGYTLTRRANLGQTMAYQPAFVQPVSPVDTSLVMPYVSTTGPAVNLDTYSANALDALNNQMPVGGDSTVSPYTAQLNAAASSPGVTSPSPSVLPVLLVLGGAFIILSAGKK